MLRLSPENRVDGAQQKLWMRIDASAAGLLWCNIKYEFLTIHASSCVQHPSNRMKIPGILLIYHLTIWYKFIVNNAFTQKNPTHNQQNLDLWPFFCQGKPHLLRTLCLCLNIIGLTLPLISCDVLKSFPWPFALANSSSFQHGFLCDHQSPYTAWTLQRRDIYEVFSRHLMDRSCADGHFGSNFWNS